MKHKYDIIIPTCKERSALDKMISEIKDSLIDFSGSIITTCFQVSASVNRNYGLCKSSSESVIMLDDDITGFFPGWADRLIETLQNDSDHVMVSARLMNSDGTLGMMMSIEPDISTRLQYVDGYLPSACIAFRNDGMRFDCGFEGSSWEDTDFCDSLHVKYPNGKFVIDNDVRLVHINEMKNGNSSVFERNRQYYMRKHPDRGVNV